MLRYYNEIICSYDVAPMGLSIIPLGRGVAEGGGGNSYWISPRWGYCDVAPLGLSASFPSDEGSPKAGVGLLLDVAPLGLLHPEWSRGVVVI